MPTFHQESAITRSHLISFSPPSTSTSVTTFLRPPFVSLWFRCGSCQVSVQNTAPCSQVLSVPLCDDFHSSRQQRRKYKKYVNEEKKREQISRQMRDVKLAEAEEEQKMPCKACLCRSAMSALSSPASAASSSCLYLLSASLHASSFQSSTLPFPVYLSWLGC